MKRPAIIIFILLISFGLLSCRDSIWVSDYTQKDYLKKVFYVYLISTQMERRFVGVGINYSSYTTDDVVVWNDVAYTGTLYNVVYGDGRFVAVGPLGEASYSTDGASWTSANHNNGDMYGVAYGNGLFVAAGINKAAIYSTDGITWHGANHNDDIRGICYGEWF